ncbi:hypothetical protein Leryth_018398 [Lithospermum erythrorhizon]|nr:hypothetical protein Leryth_018398 [Lithospermum erythrorhizon]
MFSQKSRKCVPKIGNPSAYDTAWLSMIEDHEKQEHGKIPLFKCCLDWILNNQKGLGFWGESFDDGFPTIDSLPATLACMVALTKWGLGSQNIQKGIVFVHAAIEVLLKEDYINTHFPRWFIITFPSMLQLARSTGLEFKFPERIEKVISDVSLKRLQILEMNDETQFHPPLLSYLEALSSTSSNQLEIVRQLGRDGSLYRSPSATARAYMVTGNTKCLTYLKAIVRRCSNGETRLAPMDEELFQLCLVNQIQILGLAESFTKEIDEILSQIYRNLRNQGSRPAEDHNIAKKLFKDALAFRLLRLQGYDINERSFCWFLQHEDILIHIEQNCENLQSVLYNLYRATDITFPGDNEVEKARQYSKKLLEKSMKLEYHSFDDLVLSPDNHQNMIKHELVTPWISRLDHLDHRMWIEENRGAPLRTGKASFYRVSLDLENANLKQLAAENFELRQSTYRTELDELIRWAKEKGLTNMGFGREKTIYSYYATASSLYLPSQSVIRLICAKCSIAITVADDFYDEEGSMSDLKILTDAIQTWDGKYLTGHGKTIFDAVDDIVRFIASSSSTQDGSMVETELRDIWRETFRAWMTEREWSESGYVPSLEEYMEVGCISIAAHVLVLSPSCFLNPSIPIKVLKSTKYLEITNLLMASTRLLNDMQSYQKEIEQGKINYVLLYMKENPRTSIDDAIEEVKRIVNEKRKALLEIALKENQDDQNLCGTLPNKTFKQLHLGCLKGFSMFFNSSNLFDSKTALVNEINKAIFLPLNNLKEDETNLSSRKSPSKQVSGSSLSLLGELSLRNKKNDTLGTSAFLWCKKGNFKYDEQVGRSRFVGLKKTSLFDVGNGSYYTNYAPTMTITSRLCIL